MARHPRLGALERAIYAIIRTGPWPTHTDLEGVILALSRVQFTYRLDPIDMADGEICSTNVDAIDFVFRYLSKFLMGTKLITIEIVLASYLPSTLQRDAMYLKVI